MDQVREKLELPERGGVDGAGVRVAVLDSGIDPEHPDLRGKWDEEASLSCVTLDSRITDQAGHGTHIAGIIAGDGVASDGLYRGIAPGVQLLVVRVFSASGLGHSDSLAAGVNAAIDWGADIINYSGGSQAWVRAGGPPPWAWSDEPDAGARALEVAAKNGTLVVAAAGNCGPRSGSVERPGSLALLLSVGALKRSGSVADGSARGPVYVDPSLPRNKITRDIEKARVAAFSKPDLVMPGGDEFANSRVDALRKMNAYGTMKGGIISARSEGCFWSALSHGEPGRWYTRISGTSQATAVCTGVAALGLQYSRDRGLDLGDDRGKALRSLLCAAAAKGADGQEWGRGTVTWPSLQGTIDHYLDRPAEWKLLLEGGQGRLRALP